MEDLIDYYRQRRELNSPGMQAARDTVEVRPENEIRQQAASYYQQVDQLDKNDPEYETKLEKLGDLPYDNDGNIVDRSGKPIPEPAETHDWGGSLEAEIARMQQMGMAGAEENTRQAELERVKKEEKRRARAAIARSFKPAEPMITAEEMANKPWYARMGLSVAGGVTDAIMETARTGSLLLYKMTDAVTDLTPEQEAAFDYLNSPEADAYAGPFGALKVESDGSLPSELVRDISQFMIPFLGALKATKIVFGAAGVGTSAAATLAEGTAAGAVVDFSAFSSADGNMADLLLSLGVDSDLLRYMSAEKSATQLEGKLKQTIDGAVFGMGFEIALAGGKWIARKTNAREGMAKTAAFLFEMTRSLRSLNQAKVKEIEDNATRVIAEYEAERVVNGPVPQLPAPPDKPQAGPADKQGATGKPDTEKKTDTTNLEQQEMFKGSRVPKYEEPPIEVREAYAELAMSKILTDGMSENEWKALMSGRTHPKLIEDSYRYATEYLASDKKTAAYHSITQRAILGIKMKKQAMPGNAWSNRIKGLMKYNEKNPDALDPQSIVLDAEVRWTGLDQFLKRAGNKPVTKEEVIQYLRENKVELEDIDRGKGEGVQLDEDEMQSALDEGRDEWVYDNMPEISEGDMRVYEVAQRDEISLLQDDIRNDYEDEWRDEFREDLEDQYTDPDTGEVDEDGLNEAIENAIDDRAYDMAVEQADQDPILYGSYDLESGKTLTISGSEGRGFTIDVGNSQTLAYSVEEAINEAERMARESLYDASLDLTPDQLDIGGNAPADSYPFPKWEDYLAKGPYEDYNEFLITYPKLNFGVVNSTHFGDENILPHVRTTVRPNTDGAKSLHIEEAQNDYANEGMNYGYKGDNENKQKVKAWEKLREKLKKEILGVTKKEAKTQKKRKAASMDIEKEFIHKSKADDPSLRQFQKLSRKIKGFVYEYEKAKESLKTVERKLKGTRAVNPNPWQENEKWIALSLRRMLRYAADEGYDRLTWSNAKMVSQAEGLVSRVNAVQYDFDNGILLARKSGQNDFKVIQTNVSPADVQKYVSKERADKLVYNAIQSDNGVGNIEGSDLIAIEGYRNLYEKQMPKVMREVLRSWPDAKLSKVQIDVGDGKTETVFAVDITPKMKRSLRAGVRIMDYAPIIPGAGVAAGMTSGVMQSDDTTN